MKSLQAESHLMQADPDADADLRVAILQARQRSLVWYAAMQASDQPAGVMRTSAAHDPKRWPGMLLPGTNNGLMGLVLLGGMDAIGAHAQPLLAAWLLSHRRADGIFRISDMQDSEVYKKPNLDDTWQYIDFHVTNYSLGAIECVAPDARFAGAFAEKYLDLQTLKAWLAERDMRDPWQEGNNIVNLGSFLMLLMKQGDGTQRRRAQAALEVMFDWHDRLQEPATGFWGVGQLTDPLRTLHAMAGSMHNYHLWYATGRPLTYQDKAVDYCLSQPSRVHSACIDVDLVDLLVHAYWQIDHRRADIQSWLRALLPGLLAFQNADGGFADVRGGPDVPPRRQDGWVGGYAEHQGLSNTFATWFRWIAIAMTAECLWPDWIPFAGGWRFRRTPGIGYCQPAAQRPRP